MKQLPLELDEFLKQYNKEKDDYEQLSSYILLLCSKYKQNHPNNIRVVFSRQPAVKEWGSIVNKINLKRSKLGSNGYKYGDLEDIIGITVLCAFESDKRAFVNWLRKAFNVITQERDAKVDNYETGHRGLHYIIKLNGAAYNANPRWFGKKCEIQVKTLLEEAFDAKSHDLAYKPGHRVVSDELKLQFAHFSQVLRAVDQQSEFLKSLIMADETQIELRRAACVTLYFYLSEANNLLNELGVNPTEQNIAPQRLSKLLSEIQERGEQNVDLELCRFAALCALKWNDDLFAQQAFVLCELFLGAATRDSNALMAIANIEWALGNFETAIGHVKKAIDFSVQTGRVDEVDRAKSTFVYLVTDWWVMRRGSNADWVATASQYAKELEKGSSAPVWDTLGFYAVVFGASRNDVEKGRKRLRIAHAKASKEFHPFYVYHDYVAVKRLMELPNDPPPL